MKIYQMRQRINNPLHERNILGLKYPFHEALVNGNPIPSKIVDPRQDSKKLGRVFSWGYHGLFPNNLAISLLCDFFEIEDYAMLFEDSGYGYATSRFYRDFIVENEKPYWELSEDQLWNYMSNVVKQAEKEGLINA